MMNKEQIKNIVVGKLLNKEFDLEFDEMMILYMKEGTVLGNLSRLSKKINMEKIQKCNRQEFTEWQFSGDEDDE